MRRIAVIGTALAAIIASTTVWELTHRTSQNGSAEPSAKVVVAETVGSSTPPSATTTFTATTAISTPSNGERSKVGATRAAVRFLKTDETLFPSATPVQARALSDSMTSTRSRARLGDLAEQHQRDTLAKGDLEGLILRLAPIASRVRNYTDDHATVDIYFLRLWSFPSKGALDDYATVQLDLVWEQNNWRLNDSSLIDGPYPVARFANRPIVASSAARFESTLAGYDDEAITP